MPSMQLCQRRLATVWFVGTAVILAIQVSQSILGRFGQDVDKAWGWLLPNVAPTSTLIVTVLVLEAQGRGSGRRSAPAFLYRLTMGLCVGYLALLLVTILAQPFSSIPVLSAMQMANLWLGPVQGLASAALGAFFFHSGAAALQEDR